MNFAAFPIGALKFLAVFLKELFQIIPFIPSLKVTIGQFVRQELSFNWLTKIIYLIYSTFVRWHISFEILVPSIAVHYYYRCTDTFTGKEATGNINYCVKPDINISFLLRCSSWCWKQDFPHSTWRWDSLPCQLSKL